MNIKKRLRTDRFVFASLLLLFIIGGGTRLNGSHQPVKIELDNRLQIIYQQDLASEMTVVKLFFRGGQSAEPASKRGLAFLTTRLCTELQTRGMIREMVELGSAIHVNSEGDFSSIQVKSLSENLDKTLEILVNNIRDPLLSSIRINNIKRFMKHVQKNESDTVQRLFIVTSLSHFFGNTGYGGSNMGTEVSLKGIKKKDIK